MYYLELNDNYVICVRSLEGSSTMKIGLNAVKSHQIVGRRATAYKNLFRDASADLLLILENTLTGRH